MTGTRTTLTIAAIAAATAAAVLGVTLAVLWQAPQSGPTFRCNGTTGVYTGRSGAPAIQPYDPACGGAE